MPIDNNTAEWAMRKVALGRKNWLLVRIETGGERAAVIHSLIETCRHLGIDPHECQPDVLRRVGDHPRSRMALTPRWRLAAIAAAGTSSSQAHWRSKRATARLSQRPARYTMIPDSS